MSYTTYANPEGGYDHLPPNWRPGPPAPEIIGVGVTRTFLAAFLRSLNLRVADAACQLNIVGLRGALPAGSARINVTRDLGNPHPEAVTNENDDTVIVFGKKSDGSDVLKLYSGSVDPGSDYTRKPMNKKGCAHLCNGQYEYTIGTHTGASGSHEALVEYGKVRIWRDANGDGSRDASDPIEEGVGFGIHIHAGGKDAVGKNSAGCVNIQGGWNGAQWKSFLKLIKEGHDPMPILVTIADATALVNF